MKSFLCEVCKGTGHNYLVCPTRKRLDNFAEKRGDKLHWGAWKWKTYYKQIHEARVAEEKDQSFAEALRLSDRRSNKRKGKLALKVGKALKALPPPQ